jgi:hypothetical protein
MESSAKTEHFRRWVFWTGIFNIVAYSQMLCPFTLKIYINTLNGLNNALGLGGTVLSIPENVNHVIMINLLGLLVVFAGICLIIASLDIEKRAWFVFWEGFIGRFFSFLFFLYYVLFSSASQILLLSGIIDLIIGIIYMYYIFTIKNLKIT